MMRWADRLEHWVKVALVLLMLLVIVLATLDLAVGIARDISRPPYLLDVNKIMPLLGSFFLVLIGLELLETVKGYFRDHAVHADAVFLVAMTALARKVIILEVEKYDGWHLLGLAAVILALSVGYYLCKRAGRSETGLSLGSCLWPGAKGEGGGPGKLG